MWVESHLYLNEAAFAGFAGKMTAMPTAIVMFAANSNKDEINACITAIRQIWPDTEIIGTTTRGIILNGEDIFRGISLTLLGSDSADTESVGIGLASANDQRGKLACELLMAKSSLRDARMIVTFSTLSFDDGAQFASDIDSRFSNTCLIGGSSCNDPDLAPLVWHGDRLLEDGIVALVIHDPALAIEGTWYHGLKSLGAGLAVGSMDGRYVQTLGGMNATEMLSNMFGESILDSPQEVLMNSLPVVSIRGDMPLVNRSINIDAQLGVETEHALRRGEEVCMHAEHPGRVHEKIHNIALRMLDQPVSGILYFTAASRLTSHFRAWNESRALTPFGVISGAWLNWHFAWNDGRNRVMTETASLAFIGSHNSADTNRLHARDFPLPHPARPEQLMFETVIEALDRGWQHWNAQVESHEDSRIRYETVLENMSDGVSILTADGISIYESRTNQDIHGYSTDDLTGQSFLDMVVHPDDRDTVQREWTKCLRHPGQLYTLEARCVSATGKITLVQLRLRNCLDEENVRGVIMMLRDITDIRRIEDELRRQATIDGLTGVANRRHFAEMADMELTRARRYDRPLSFIIFDIDHFKRFNDNYGHQTGDDVLLLVASLVSTMMRKTDFVGRLGGEEFGILLPETPLSGALEKAEQLRAIIAEERLQVGDDMLTITASFGVSEVQATEMFDALMHRADMALYEAKNAGRNRVKAAPDKKQ